MSAQINYNIESETGTFVFSTNIETGQMERACIYDGLTISRVTSGSGVWQIGGEICNVKTGDLIFLSNLEPRRVISGFIGLEAFSINAAILPSAGALECLRVFYGRGQTFTHAIRSDELLRIYQTIREESLSASPSFVLLLAYAIELLIGANRHYDERYPDALEKNFRCDAITVGAIAASAAYINEHLTADLSVAELAKLAGMSEGHYTRMFRKYVSVTPIDYIARCRIKRFLSLMSEGKANILDTAFACGFTSSSGFYKTFRRICGRAPTAEATENVFQNQHLLL